MSERSAPMFLGLNDLNVEEVYCINDRQNIARFSKTVHFGINFDGLFENYFSCLSVDMYTVM